MKRLLQIAIPIVLLIGIAFAQERPLSPRGIASAHVGGKWVNKDDPTYVGGQWIEIDYGRPIKRGRANLFGSGATYGQQLNAGAPVWRAGANQSTRLKTDVPLVFGGRTVPAGEYSVFVDLKEQEWTLIISRHAAQQTFNPQDTAALWGSFGYTPDKDVLRAKMKVESLRFSVEEFTIAFLDMTDAGGRLAMMWDRTLGSIPFTLGQP